MSGGVGLKQDQTGAHFPVNPTFVRGINFPSGWFFEPHGKDCRVSYVIHADLKGWFTPLIVVRLFVFYPPRRGVTFYRSHPGAPIYLLTHSIHLRPRAQNNAIGGSFVAFFTDLKNALRAAGLGNATLTL